LLDRRVSPFAATTGRDIDWWRGFIRSAQLHDASGLHRLLEHPAARFLRNLTLAGNPDLVPILVDGPNLPLRRLVLDNTTRPDMRAELPKKFPRLEHLDVVGAAIAFDEIDLPHLERLLLRNDRCSDAALNAICRGHLDRLVELELWCDSMEGPRSSHKLVPLLSRDLPHLRIVRFGRIAMDIADFVLHLANAPFAHRLEVIDLFESSMSVEAIRNLIAVRDRFQSLQILAVDGYNAAGVRRLELVYGDRIRTEPVAKALPSWRE